MRFKVGDKVKLAHPHNEGWSSVYINKVGVVMNSANYTGDAPVYLVDFVDPPGTPSGVHNGWFGEHHLAHASNGIERARKCLKKAIE